VTLAMDLPRGDTLPASAGRLARQGVVRVVTHMQGHGHAARVTRTLLVIYHPRVTHPRGARSATHKVGTAHAPAHALFGIYIYR